jgi:anti-anti-sigma factor
MIPSPAAVSVPLEVRTVCAAEPRVLVCGDLDCHSYCVFNDVLAGLLTANPRLTPLRLDLSGVTFIDSAGLASLVRARHALFERGGDVILCDCSPYLRRVLARTCLDKLFTVEG